MMKNIKRFEDFIKENLEEYHNIEVVDLCRNYLGKEDYLSTSANWGGRNRLCLDNKW